MSGEKKLIDWAGIEREYRAGIRSLRSIGKEFGVSEGAIRKRADRDGWTKDLSAKIRAKADDLVRKAEVRNQVRSATEGAYCAPDESERNVIEVNAQVQATVMREHRSTLNRTRALVNGLLAELEMMTISPELIERLVELVGEKAESDAEIQAHSKRLEAVAKVLGMHARVDSLKKLVDSVRIVVQTEREVFGMDAKDAPKDNPFEDMTPDQVEARIAYLLEKASR